MVKPLSPKTIEIVTACIPALEQHGVAITTEMYQRLLQEKSVADLFNLSHQKDGSQPRSLATAILVFAENVKDPSKLGAMIERIAEKHVSLNILPEHYPAVGKALLGAIKHVLGDAATDDIMAAWTEAYGFLADVFIGREAEIYDEHAKAPGGWRGWRKFIVESRHKESEEMSSFILTPEDGKPVLEHKAGQYLGFKLDIPGAGSQRRNYSISSTPSQDKYRVSIQTVKDGVVSTWFNEKVKVGQEFYLSDPSGDFILERNAKPLVFISGGSGLTPMISMLGDIEKSGAGNRVHYVHSTRTQETESFGDYIRKLASAGKLTADVFYTRGTKAADAQNVKCHEGRMPKDFLSKSIDQDSICYICGPQSFTLEVIAELQKMGLKPDQIRYELFGSVTTPSLAI